MNIFVGSLPFRLEEEDLRAKFEVYGEVSSCKIISDKYSGKSKGFGFIEMPNEESGKKAIEELNGSELEGRAIVVNVAEDKKDDRRSFGGGDRGGYKGGSSSRGGYKGGDSRRGGYRGSDSRGGSSRGGDSRRSNY